VKDNEVIKKAEEIIKEMIGLLNIRAKHSVSMEVDEADEKFLKVTIEGEDIGHVIGYRGNTLNALQLIFSQMLSREIGENVTVLVDVNGFRERRKRYLESLALRAVQQARESKQDIELPPLSPYERRVIHILLKKEEDISTESVGEGEDRHIVIKFSPQKETP
jgi:spoIIIJ-associated protein